MLMNGVAHEDYRSLTNNSRWLQRAARMVMEEGILGQFSLARQCLYGEE